MFGKLVKLRTPMENTVEIERLKERIKKLENKKEACGEVYVRYGTGMGSTRWSWREFNQDDMLDEVNGYVKLSIGGYIFGVFGLKGTMKYKSANDSTFWVKKDCLVWHNKDQYFKERKKLEDRVDKK